ncbi:dipeptide ABC transporter ATP-binding protein [Hyphococcus sp.]|uniref:dipeptide ABC transporter ATP-binding protein n=1 Tax=Hyphococcus sp. TaxID=2038636 RepID=UPI003CCC2D43
MKSALAINSLSVTIDGAPILSDINFLLQRGKITGLIGRSGSGKSMTALAMMGLCPRSAKITGAVVLNDQNLLELDDKNFSRLRGKKVSMVFQEPMTALNPLQTIGDQVSECFLTHENITRDEARRKAGDILRRVGLPANEISPKRRPHELSGGQRQRVVIAIAIAMKPTVLIADEPTTALDVTTQAEILSLLESLTRTENIALLLITHDLAVVSAVADEIVILTDGKIENTLSADQFYSHRGNQHAKKFLPARAEGKARPSAPQPAVLTAKNVSCYYAEPRSILQKLDPVRAVDNVSFSLSKSEILGLVGESGSGKSTLARALLALQPLSGGAVFINNKTFPSTTVSTMRSLRRNIQIVFQDPYSSFNPRQRVRDIICEPLHLLGGHMEQSEKTDRAAVLLNRVGLDASALQNYPHAFSGGQRQRIALARALATEPSIIVLDEATSALDITARNRILDLLQSLRDERGVSFLIITHDLSVIRDIADRVMVMKDGKIIETGPTQNIFNHPAQAYTNQLIEAAPVVKWRYATNSDGARG